MVTRSVSTVPGSDVVIKVKAAKKNCIKYIKAKWMEDEKKKRGWKFEIRYYDSAPMAVEDVVNGRIDAAAMNYPPARDAERKKDVQIIGAFGEVEEFGAAVRKEDQEMLDTLNKGFEMLKADPYWEELISKHLNK